MLVTTQCASYCRYCTRSRIVATPLRTSTATTSKSSWITCVAPRRFRDVLLSGGDALTSIPSCWNGSCAACARSHTSRSSASVSRVPVFLPQRIDDELCDMLAKYHPLWMNLHFNHPNEITPEVARAADKLTRAGIPLGNQSVLLAGVNDCIHIMRALVHRLVENRIRPYYIYQCDLVEGSGHFRTPVGKGIEIMEGLRGHTSGYAVPTYVVDAPGGGGKIPVMPNYLISYSDHKVILRNFEGYITTYEEPTEYTAHDKANCKYCQNPRPEPGQGGVEGLLDGNQMWIQPSGFESAQSGGRNRGRHRLQDPSKWVPYGVGPIEGTAGEPRLGLEPGSDAPSPETAVVGGPNSAAGGAVPETTRKEPAFEYPPGEEPRPREGEPTGWSHGSCSSPTPFRGPVPWRRYVRRQLSRDGVRRVPSARRSVGAIQGRSRA